MPGQGRLGELVGALDENGSARVRVADFSARSLGAFDVKIVPRPSAPATVAPPPIDLSDPGVGPAAVRRRRPVNEIVDKLRQELARTRR